MRAVRFDEYGSEDVLTVVEVPDPHAGPGQVVVTVRAAGINPGEVGIRTGALSERWPAHFPEGEGSDFAGVVLSVGDGVTGVAVGDEVIGYTDERASHAEQVVVPAGQLTPKPQAVPWEVAGTLYVAPTAGHALVDAASVVPGDVVVVSGAAGGVGSVAAQWARRAGATVIGLASPDNHAWLRSREIIPVDYHGGDLAGRIRDAAGAPVTALLDAVGAPYPRLGIDLGIEPARIATVADFAAGALGVQVVFHHVTANAAMLAELAQAVAEGALEIPIRATFPLDQVGDAYRLLGDRHTRGKIVLVP
ncbi:NADP-dependent oxidoreductase [Microbacterium sp. KR10-403]|uniref:NADP-dependent oxidoreductase n=1 Tax=Microbacterium sp. KR10-403 TaxID=3158581 RepID=UPI0032E39B57